MKAIWKFLKDEDGLELAEYAVMGALIIAVGVAAVTLLGTNITGRINSIATTIGAP